MRRLPVVDMVYTRKPVTTAHSSRKDRILVIISDEWAYLSVTEARALADAIVAAAEKNEANR